MTWVLNFNFLRFVTLNSYNFKLTKSQTPCNTKLIYFRVSNVLVRLSTWSVYWFSNQINFILQTHAIQTHDFFYELAAIQNLLLASHGSLQVMGRCKSRTLWVGYHSKARVMANCGLCKSRAIPSRVQVLIALPQHLSCFLE